MSSSGLPWSARSRVRLLEKRLQGMRAMVDDLVQDAHRLGESAEQTAAAKVTDRRAQAERNSADAMARAVHDSTGASAEAYVPQARELAARVAPGLGSIDLDSDEWTTDKLVGAGVSHLVRLGQLDLNLDGTEPVPVVLPLLGRSGWQVRADDPATAYRLIQSVVLRLVGATPAFRLRMDTYDPSLTGAMGLLGRVSSAQPQIVAPATHTPDELRGLLTELRTVSSQRASRLAQQGHARFEDMLDDNNHVADAYRLVVLLDYPSGIDIKVQQELVRLAASGGDRGMCFLVHHSDSPASDDDVDPSELTSLLDPVRLLGTRAEVDTFRDLRIRVDRPVAPHVAAEVSEAIVEAAKSAELPTVDFASTLPERERWWQPAHDELSTVVGLDDRIPATIALRSGNPALPHVLIGGAVGQGKSNLLLVLVHGLAVRYAPRDLEMYLLDFKHGVEFAALGPTDRAPYWLPHLRVLGVHSDVAFGLAVLGHLVEELERRSDLFKAAGNVTDIADFPAADAARPPRVLVVLDEFQVMFEDETTADDAARMIEKLVRLGRAYGIHVVLSTQTIEGMQRLATRKDSIFGQVPYRIALKSTQADSQGLLRTGNTAAAELRFRGEAILNANFGAPDDNRRIVVAHAEREALSRLRETLWTMHHDPRPPRIFHLAESADLTTTLATFDRAAAGQGEAWAGMPISVAEEPASIPLRGEPGAGVIVLGDSPADALGVLTGLSVSAAASGERPSIIVLDGTRGVPGLDDAKHALSAVLEGMGCSVEIVPADQVAERLASLRRSITDATSAPALVVGLGMHGIPNLTATGADGITRPVDDLQKIVRDGPSRKVFTVAWWNRLHVCTEHLGYDRCNISTYLFLRHPQDGVRTVCGPLVRWDSERHRALLFDGMGGEPEVVVPFAPLAQSDVPSLLDAVTNRANR